MKSFNIFFSLTGLLLLTVLLSGCQTANFTYEFSYDFFTERTITVDEPLFTIRHFRTNTNEVTARSGIERLDIKNSSCYEQLIFEDYDCQKKILRIRLTHSFNDDHILLKESDRMTLDSLVVDLNCGNTFGFSGYIFKVKEVNNNILTFSILNDSGLKESAKDAYFDIGHRLYIKKGNEVKLIDAWK